MGKAAVGGGETRGGCGRAAVGEGEGGGAEDSAGVERLGGGEEEGVEKEQCLVAAGHKGAKERRWGRRRSEGESTQGGRCTPASSTQSGSRRKL